MDIGQYLKQEREMRGITLEEISNATKISPMQLRAIEAGHLEAIPSKVYLRGFIKSYAKHVGLDPVETILRYEELHGPKPAPKPLENKIKEAKPSSWKIGIRFHVNGWTAFSIIAAVVIALSVYFSMN